MKQRVFSFLLAAALAVTMTLRPVTTAHAMGAEGVIIGGAVSGPVLTGVSLTAPQIALLVAAGFGLVFAVEHADEIAAGLNAALDAAAAGVASGAEQLTRWWDNAAKGAIALAGAPAWINQAVKDWASDYYDSPTEIPFGFVGFESGVKESKRVDWWGDYSTPLYFTNEVDISRAAWWTYNEDGSFSYTVKLFIQDVPDENGVSQKVSFREDGKLREGKMPLYVISQSGTISPDNKSEYDLNAKAAISALPSIPKDSLCCDNPAHATWGTFESPGIGQTSYTKCIMDSQRFATSGSGSICPDVTVGGIGQALEDGHAIDNVTVPDMNIAGSGSICPDGVLDGSLTLDDTVADVIGGLADGTLTWTDYVADVGVGTPTISIPQEGTGTGALDYPITDTGVSDVPIEETQPGTGTTTPPPEGLAPYTLDLRDFFPFCIPFDIYEFFDILCAEPEAPVFDLGLMNPVTGEMEMYTVDLSVFDPVAEILRGMELLLFCVGLAFATKKLIGG